MVSKVGRLVSGNAPVVAALATCAIIFTVDAFTELGIAIGATYIAAIWFASLSEHSNQTFALVAISTVLIVIGYFVSPTAGEEWKALLNRALSILVTWMTAALILQRQASHRNINSQLNYIVESSADAIIGKSLSGEISYWNSGAEALYGYSADEVLGKNIALLLEQGGADESDLWLERIRMGEPTQSFNSVHCLKNGDRITVSQLISPIQNTNKKLVGTSSIVRDISAQKKMEQEFLQLNEQLLSSNEALTSSNIELQQFAYIASHDLQAPLRHISGFVQLLQNNYTDKLDEQANDWINRTVEGVAKLQTLINDLLTFSRVESRSVEFERIDMNAACDDAIKLLQTSIDDVAAVVTRDDLPFTSGDASQITQLFENLIGNAVKYHGEASPEIHIGIQQIDNELVFSVADNGIGIEPKHFENIFVIFRRLHTEATYPGTGIGLAICKRIVTRHRGRLWLESTPGEGTTFYFMLPEARG